MKLRRLTLAFIIVLPVLLGDVFRSAGIMIHDIYWFQQALGGDLATHFLMGLALMLACVLVVGLAFRARVLTGYAVVVGFLLLNELSQLILPRRDFGFDDFLMGFAGATLVLVFALGLNRRLQGISD